MTVAEGYALREVGLYVVAIGCFVAAGLIYMIPVKDEWPRKHQGGMDDRERLFGRNVTGDAADTSDPSEIDDPPGQ